jgi:hypothetical protein
VLTTEKENFHLKTIEIIGSSTIFTFAVELNRSEKQNICEKE